MILSLLPLFVLFSSGKGEEPTFATAVYRENTNTMTISVTTHKAKRYEADSIAIYNLNGGFVFGSKVKWNKNKKYNDFSLTLRDHNIDPMHKVITFRKGESLSTYETKHVDKDSGYIEYDILTKKD